MICTLCLTAGLVAGFLLARWLYRVPPKVGEWPKAITSDGDTHEDWEDAVYIQSCIAANTCRQ